MKQEEEAVEIDGVEDLLELHRKKNAHIQHMGLNGNPEVDEDALWADEEVDEDVLGWKMKIIVSPDEDDNI